MKERLSIIHIGFGDFWNFFLFLLGRASILNALRKSYKLNLKIKLGWKSISVMILWPQLSDLSEFLGSMFYDEIMGSIKDNALSYDSTIIQRDHFIPWDNSLQLIQERIR